jgi:hypothetical protein
VLTPAAGEKLGHLDKAMAFADKTLMTDLSVGGEPHKWSHALAHQCRGRVFARQRQMSQAASAFEEAVKSAQACDYRLLEALAVRELQEHVLKPSGRAQEGQRRLSQLLSKLPHCSETQLDKLGRMT